MMQTNGRRNRSAGHQWEREGVKDFLPFYPHVQTSRQANRSRDAQKVDLANSDEVAYGRFPYNLQYKSYSKVIPYYKLLSEMPQDEGIPNVIMHRQTERAGTRFVTRGKFAIMNVPDFIDLVRYKRGYEILKRYNGFFLSEESTAQLEKELKTIGL